jgi:hypothetical protein
MIRNVLILFALLVSVGVSGQTRKPSTDSKPQPDKSALTDKSAAFMKVWLAEKDAEIDLLQKQLAEKNAQVLLSQKQEALNKIVADVAKTCEESGKQFRVDSYELVCSDKPEASKTPVK